MTRDQYNAKVQEMQRIFTDQRVRAVRADGRNSAFREGELLMAVFEVNWDGKWERVGHEQFPMSANTEFVWDDGAAMRLLAEVADSLVR